ncbi:MAG: NFACT family protein [Thermomicrobiales bacterium]
MAEEDTRRLDRWLVGVFLGLSPLLATEVIYRSGLTTNVKPPQLSVAQCEAILRHVRDLYAPLESGRWQPRVYLHDDGATFSAVPLLHLEDRDQMSRRDHRIPFSKRQARR